MPSFGDKSSRKLETCHQKLQKIMKEVIKDLDFSIIWGYRDKQLQNTFHKNGTGLPWPKSKHNRKPSMAVDIAPYPIDWLDDHRFIILAGRILEEAVKQNVKLVWGGLWHRKDLGHFGLDKSEYEG